MPRYFFHTFNGHPFGIELPGLGKARRQAVCTAGEIIRDSGSESWHGPDWHMNKGVVNRLRRCYRPSPLHQGTRRGAFGKGVCLFIVILDRNGS